MVDHNETIQSKTNTKKRWIGPKKTTEAFKSVLPVESHRMCLTSQILIMTTYVKYWLPGIFIEGTFCLAQTGFLESKKENRCTM